MRRLILIVSAVLVVLMLAGAAMLYWMFAGDGVRVALEQQASAWLGQPVTIGRARARLFPRVGLHLSDVRAGQPAQVTLGDVEVSTDLRALLSRRVEQAEVVIAESRVELPLALSPGRNEGASTAGTRAPAAGGATSAAAPVQILSVRSIALRDVRVVSRGREIDVSAQSSLTGSRLELTSFSAASGATRLTATGLVELSPRLDARLRIIGDRVDVDELLALATAFAPAAGTPARSSTTGSASGPPPRVAARVSAERATLGRVEVGQFAADLEVDGNAIALSPVSFQLFGGRYQGSLSARLGSSLTATLRSRVSDLDVAQLAAFGGATGTVTGSLTGAGTFTAQGPDLPSLMRSVRGTGTATITKGTVARLDLIRTIVLFFGRPDPGAGGGSDAFDRMDATFSVADQVVRANAFSMHAADVDVVGEGSLWMETKRLDGTLDLSLSEALSRQAGTDLYRYTREGNRVMLPGRITGTLDAPRLSIDATAAVRRGLRNELQERLKTLLDRFAQPQ